MLIEKYSVNPHHRLSISQMYARKNVSVSSHVLRLTYIMQLFRFLFSENDER